MTNEQLAVLLNNHHSQLVDIFNQLCEDLKDVDKIEYYQEKGEWLDIVEKPLFEPFEGTLFMSKETDVKRSILENSVNWAWSDTDPICLDNISGFIDDLEQSVKDLLGEKE